MGIWLVFFQALDNLKGFPKADLYEIMLNDCFRGKLFGNK